MYTIPLMLEKTIVIALDFDFSAVVLMVMVNVSIDPQFDIIFEHTLSKLKPP